MAEQYQHGGWYGGKQYNADTKSFGDVNQITVGDYAGSYVGKEVRAQSAAQQGVSAQQFDNYLQQQAGPQNNAIFQEKGMSGGGSGMNFSTAPAININDIYDKLMNSDEMKKLQSDVDLNESEIQKRRTAQSEAQGIINDNPFYAEATRVGKSAKLDEKAYKDISNFELAKQNAINKLTEARELAREKVNLEVTQHNINRDAANDALNKFNSLLASGALTNASADDIAGLAGATGLSSGMIYSAVAQARKKDQNPQIIMDDYGNATIIDANTGDIINKVSGVGKREGGGTQSASKNLTSMFTQSVASAKGQKLNGVYVGVFPQMVAQYANSMSLEEIYQNYMNTSQGKKWGMPKESARDMAELYNASSGKNIGDDDPLN